MYSAIYRTGRFFWPGGLETRGYLRELERLQWLPAEEMEAWQLDRIQRLVNFAYEHVPYYRKLYQNLDINPRDIKSLNDFRSLPFLTREHVKSHLDSLVSSKFRDKAKPESTGGSTGEPMQFFLEKSFWWWNAACEFRCRGWYGVQEGDKMAWVWGAQREIRDSDLRARLKARIMRYRYLNAFGLTEAKMQTFTEMLIRWRPVIVRAYTSALCLFAKYIKEHGVACIRPKLIETTAEKVTQPERELLEEVFQCKVADCYSARELATIAYQCNVGGLHVCETRFVEIIANERAAKPGQLGEVVVTSLNQFATPLIRYKIGDVGVYDTARCSCGRSLQVLRKLAGRTHDWLVTADGTFVHGEFFAYAFRDKPEIVRYQVYQPDKAHLQIRLVCKQKVDSAWLEKVHAELSDRFGTGIEISIQIVDEIKLTPAGKHRFIISEVKPDFISSEDESSGRN